MIKCPLVNFEEIEDGECLENSDVAEGFIKESSLPEKYRIENWREICLHCENHRYD